MKKKDPEFTTPYRHTEATTTSFATNSENEQKTDTADTASCREKITLTE